MVCSAASRRSHCLLSSCLLVLLGISVAAEPTAAVEQLSAATQAEFGAAAWIPEEAGYFAASYRARERWEAFTETRAYQEILTMPGVQLGLGWLQQQPYLGQLAMMRAENALLDDGLNVLVDAVSQETFLYLDVRGPRFINRISGLYNVLLLNNMLQGINEGTDALPRFSKSENQTRIIREVVDAEQELRMPGIVFGFRLSDPQAGRDVFARLKPLVQQSLPLPVQEESLGGGEYLTLSISAAMFLTPDALSEMEAEFGLADVDAETAEKFVQFIKSQTLSVSLGMRDDYLLISLGADNTHLESLGVGVSLAACDALAPLREHFQPRLIGLSYLHPALTSYQKMDVDRLVAKLQELLQQMHGKLPVGLAERLTDDVTELLNEVNQSLPVAKPKMAASFWKDGIETFSLSALVPNMLDSSQPLSILSHVGEAPLFAMAAHSPPSLPRYNRLVSWLKRFYGYFQDYGVPQIPAEDRAEFEQFEALVLPALQETHVATRDLLLPAIDGGQGLLVMDAGGVVSKSPDTKELLAEPIRFPRPAIVVEVSDAEKFVAAWRQYRETFNGLMTALGQLKQDVAELQLPPPEQRRLGNATLYTYSIPVESELASYLNDDFEPHALLTTEGTWRRA